jgi:uncharacterized protein (TIGR02246 family)
MNTDDEIRRVLAQYALAHDGEDVEAFLALFTENGQIVLPAKAATVGRPAIGEYLAESYARRKAASKRAKHLYANSVIDVVDGQARAISDFVAYSSTAGGPWIATVVGRCIDRLVLHDGKWLFEERQVIDARSSGAAGQVP